MIAQEAFGTPEELIRHLMRHYSGYPLDPYIQWISEHFPPTVGHDDTPDFGVGDPPTEVEFIDIQTYPNQSIEDIHQVMRAEAERQNQAMRDNYGKLQWSLMDTESMEPMIRVLEYGAKKYSADNWKKGLPLRGVFESMLRHLFALMNGEDDDPESGLPHIGHIQCNAMFIAYYLKHKPELDDRLKNFE